MRTEYARAIAPLRNAVGALAVATRELHMILANRDPQFGATEDSFRKAVTVARDVDRCSSDVLINADGMWEYIVAEIATEADEVTLDGHDDVTDALTSGYQMITQSLETLRRGFISDALQIVATQATFTAEQIHEAGELLRRLATDLVPFYGTTEKVVDLLFGFSFDRVVLDRIGIEARRAMTLRALLRANLSTKLAMLAAETSLAAAETFGKEEPRP